jgi:hypothetical protein
MRLQNYKRLLKKGEVQKAAEYAAKNGIPVETPPPPAKPHPLAAFQAQIDAAIADDLDAISAPLPEQKVAAPVSKVAAVKVEVAPPPVGPPAPVAPKDPLPWPEKTTGLITAQCLNPRLVMLKIADGRTTTMFNYGQRPWAIGARVKVKINQRRGTDAIYETDFGP